MAKNLRAKMPSSNTLVILDVNSDMMKRFVEEINAAAKSSGAGPDSMKVETAQNAREVAEKSVSGNNLRSFFFSSVEPLSQIPQFCG